MTFVYPFLLGGLILAALPVVVHLLIRKKPVTLLFPAFRFLTQKQKSNTRNLRLRHLLLLLLRVALLVLLCLALARPRLFYESIGISREKPIALVLVFDTSPSMEYKHDEITRLELAKKRCLELLDQLPADCKLLVLDTAEPAIVREDFHRSFDKARQRINGLTIRPHSTAVSKRVAEAMRRLDQLEDDGAEMPRFVCVFSDRTKASWDAAASVKPPAGVQAFFFDVGIEQPIDLAITHLELPASPQGQMRQSFADGEKIALRVALRATGKDHEGDILCQVGGHELRQHFHVQADAQQTVTFEIDTDKRALRPGFHQALVKLESSDALAFNNQRHVTFKIRERARVLVLANDVKKAVRFESALKALLYSVEVRPVNVDGPLDHDAVFLDGVAAPTDRLWQALAGYIEKGGGLGIIPAGDTLQMAAYNSAPARRVMPAEIVAKITHASGDEAVWDPRPDELLHPFLLPYGVWVDEGASDFLRYPRGASQYWEVKPIAGQGAALFRYNDGRPALVERIGKGRVLLLTTPLEAQKPEWTNYHDTNTSFYIALTWLCTRHLIGAPANPDLNHRFGSEPPTVKTPIVGFPKYVLTGPEVAEEIRFDNERGLWVGEALPRAGSYTLAGTNADKLDPKVIAQFSINVPSEESDLTRVAVSEIEAVLGKDSVVAQDRRTPVVDTLHWKEPIELFPWLMMLLLLFLAIENLLANRFYRPETPTP